METRTGIKVLMDPKLEIYNDTNTPPDGWRFTVPETGFQLRAWTAKILAGKVMAHMEANDLPVPVPFQPWWEDAVCRQMRLGEPFCGPVLPKPDQGAAELTREMLMRFTRTVWGMFPKFKLVPQDVAEARAEICAKCPMNVTYFFGCAGCETMLRMVGKMLGKRKTAVDAQLGYCKACGCSTRLKTFCPDDVLDKAENGQSIPYFTGCWRLKSR